MRGIELTSLISSPSMPDTSHNDHTLNMTDIYADEPAGESTGLLAGSTSAPSELSQELVRALRLA